MAERGGQPGNQNAKRGADWRQALKRALAHKSGKTYREGLDQVASKVVEAACNGEYQAWREIADRMDGRSPQSLEIEADVKGEHNLNVTFPDGS